ncbi:DUF692 domain-containing protein [Devosia sp. BSSL-BM10]|uniref:UPF0276 protein KD146_15025 n=1 Tax=Devosia litorisediminis TaxID=2829817 RepID=A0A942I7D0_9HYPH|nr:DUF692 domain-containing protein [Devosia litorisediminis]MBS3850013.1 DUF692 domain-containing protein [Devosia litorisediminis]
MPANHLPARAGLGLKPQHYAQIIETAPDIGFFEVHAENYMGDGGPPHRYLTAIAERYPISLHGVGLSIGGEGPLDTAHLTRLRALIDRYQPQSFSEHLAWSSHDESALNDLLPLPYTQATLDTVVAHIDQVQQVLGRRMLLENPSTYVLFAESTIDEVDFLAAIAQRTGCGLLLDVNNVMVSAVNHQTDAASYINRFPVEAVGEIHLAGYDEAEDAVGDRLLIDAHASRVSADVFDLFRHTLGRTGPMPTLVEWDNNVPSFDILADEARLADDAIGQASSQIQRRAS